MIQIVEGDMRNSRAHIFVYIFSINRVGNPLIEAPFSQWPAELLSKIHEVMDNVAASKQPGRLWTYPIRLPWPDDGAPVPNGQKDRTVWYVIIPQAPSWDKVKIEQSLELLASWIKATHLPLKIAVCNNGKYYDNQLLTIAKREFHDLLEKYLGEWEVEEYDAWRG